MELRTLGTLSVRATDGRELHALVAQPKRFALLAYLCLATPRGFHQREALLGLFWPEADEPHARAALRKALHVVRQAVGDDVVLSRGDEQIGVAFNVVSCDAVAFQDLVRESRPDEALNLYRGDLLPGFFVDDAPEFERWLERERSRLRELAATAAQQLAERLESAQRLEEAVVAARTALALAGTDERALRRLLALLGRIGDRAGAVAAYDAFVQHVAEDAGVEPSSETQALVRRIRANQDAGVSKADAEVAKHAAEPLGTEADSSPHPPHVDSRRNWRFVVAVSGSAIAVAGLLAWAWAWQREPRARPAETAAVDRWDMVLPDSAPLAFVGAGPLGIGRTSLAIAPNGRRLVYVARQGSTTRLYLREIGQLEATPLTGTDGAYHPFFSPDGDWVGFFTGSMLKKLSLRGGQPVTLASVTEPFGATWAPNDRILVADRQGNDLVWVSAGGGRPQRMDRHPGVRVLDPQLVPGGEWLLHGSSDGALYLHSLATGWSYAITRDRVVRRDSADLSALLYGTNPRYLESGHIAYFAVNGALMVLPFDVAQGKATGPPAEVLQGVRVEAEAGGAQIAVARNGTVVYARGESARAGAFVWVDHTTGRIDTLPLPKGEYGGFDLSPDGRQVAVTVRSATGRVELWVMDAAGGPRARVLTQGIPIGSPRWWPGGGSLMYQAIPRDGNMNYGMRAVFRQSIRDPADREVLPPNALEPSPDGEQVVTTDSGGLSLTPRSQPDRSVRLAAAVTPFFTSFSPDGRWLAYTDVDDPTLQSEVYVTRVGQPADRYKVSVSGGEEPVWTPDGGTLIYRRGQQWWAADLLQTRELRVRRTRRLFEGPFLNVPGVSHDVAAQGGRQLVLLGPSVERTNRLVLVTNWFTEIERLTLISR